ncbi:MAG: oligoendopeptidase F [Chloroflexi bacterium]|nr:MAG: oligoendopeptidase F [Chloroflexota bacterium]MBA4374903.1 oligoendopeptidase F [Anaerolinea sp.]
MTTYTQKRWSLVSLYPSATGPEFKHDFKDIETKTTEFEKFRELLKKDISEKDFMTIIKALEQVYRLAHRMGSFAGLWFAEDTQNQAALTLVAKTEQQQSEINNRTLFFGLWWKELPDAAAERLMKNSGDYRYWLEEMRHFKKHTLTEPEEKIINTKNVTGINALTTLYDSMTNRYVFTVEVDGEKKEMTRGELMSLVRGADADLRARAYQELYRVYGENGDILGQMYQTIVRDWRNEEVTLRKFDSPISARNLANDLPDEVIDLLLSVAEKNTGVFQRFFKLKAKLIGVKKLRRYDVYAPVAKADKPYEYEKAAQKVLESFTEFDPRFAEMAERVFKEDHLDAEVRKGKRGGAFCATVTPDMTPWVLLNYQGKTDDVATMAHELGHAIHSMLADEHTLFTQHACLPLAETASTFGEMMLVDRLLAEEPDEAVKRDLLFRQVDNAYATIQRQSFFAMFEKEAHQMIVDGASVDEISEAYMKNLKKQFGDAVEVADEFKWEWVSIPHIYQVPFYVYAYAFGQLLVLSLYKRFKEEGESFKPKYIQLLAAGGSEAPMKVLAEAGVDVTKAKFWQGGFDVLSKLVDELEKTVK